MIRARDLVAEIDTANNTTTHGLAQPVDCVCLPATAHKYRFRYHAVQSDTNALEALRTMAERGTCALLVIQENEVIGLVTEQDYSCKVANQRRQSATTTVAAIMSPHPETINADATAEDCLEFASHKRVQYLCVVDGHEILGLISIADISRALVTHRERYIRNLTHYIVSESQAM